MLTGRTQICKTTGAVKHDENRCPLGRTTGKAAGAPLCVAHGFAVWYFTNTSGRAASQVPSCGEHPQLSHGRMKSWGWVGQERGGRRHHPPDHTFSDSSLCFIIGCCLNDLLGHLLTVIGGN